jgi:hypothetical protein
MTHSDQDRRQRRSNDPITALHYQLAYARHTGGFDALVLVDETGALVAGAGAWPLCEELAAYAPLLADDEGAPESATSLRKLRPQVRMQAIDFQGSTVLLAARGAANDAAEGSLGAAAVGCLRILATGGVA